MITFCRLLLSSSLLLVISTVEDERQAKLGVRECVQHELLTPYPVLFERPGTFMAHVKMTVLLLPSGTAKITGKRRGS